MMEEWNRIHATFDGAKSLPELCLDLFFEQKKNWDDLRGGFESLREVRERDLSCQGFSVRLQHNPRRIKSSLAGMVENHVTDLKCFLCLDNLPQVQKGILYRNDYLILCNPMPILSLHFTVSHLDHCPQTIAENIDTFLKLLVDFGFGWTVLYNGPNCGASAPDHLHFHAARSGQMPIEKEIREEKRLTLIKKIEGVLLYRMEDVGREIIVLKGKDPIAVKTVFKSYLSALKKVLLLDEEPMINMAGFYEEREWRLVIFPRRKHRPDAFFREGDARIVVSPGAIDMGGLLVTPVKKDFEQLDEAAVESIYAEVSLEGKIAGRTIDTMLKDLAHSL
jgi:hypothetical protein